MKKTLSIFIALVLLLITAGAALADTNVTSSGAGSAMVSGPLYAYAAPGSSLWGTGVPAVVTWKHPSWPTISGSNALWISNTEYIGGEISADSWRKFSTTRTLCTGAYNVSVNVQATADNAEEVWVNAGLVGSDGEDRGTSNNDPTWSTIKTYSASLGTTNQVVVDFIVRNYQMASSAPTTNPTGLIYNLTVNYSCPVEVDIDIKPSSYPSCFNNDGNGIIPVAINGSAGFDVKTVDPGTVRLAGLAVTTKGKSDKLMAAYEDWNGDGYTDLVLKFVDSNGTFAQGKGSAILNGSLLDGTPFFGTGDICITQ